MLRLKVLFLRVLYLRDFLPPKNVVFPPHPQPPFRDFLRMRFPPPTKFETVNMGLCAPGNLE